MVFSESSFLFLFLPLTLICYFAFGKRARNWVSLHCQPDFLRAGRAAIHSHSAGFHRHQLLGGDWAGRLARANARQMAFGVWHFQRFGIADLFQIRQFFRARYQPSFFGVRLAQNRFELAHIALPLGISFFTFHKISYKVDVFRSSAKVRRDPLELALYILLFPQLIAGPIIRYHEIADQIAKRAVTDSRLCQRRAPLHRLGWARKC